MRITIDIDDATGAVTITPGTNAPDTSAAEERRIAAVRSFTCAPAPRSPLSPDTDLPVAGYSVMAFMAGVPWWDMSGRPESEAQEPSKERRDFHTETGARYSYDPETHTLTGYSHRANPDEETVFLTMDVDPDGVTTGPAHSGWRWQVRPPSAPRSGVIAFNEESYDEAVAFAEWLESVGGPKRQREPEPALDTFTFDAPKRAAGRDGIKRALDSAHMPERLTGCRVVVDWTGAEAVTASAVHETILWLYNRNAAAVEFVTDNKDVVDAIGRVLGWVDVTSLLPVTLVDNSVKEPEAPEPAETETVADPANVATTDFDGCTYHYNAVTGELSKDEGDGPVIVTTVASNTKVYVEQDAEQTYAVVGFIDKARIPFTYLSEAMEFCGWLTEQRRHAATNGVEYDIFRQTVLFKVDGVCRCEWDPAASTLVIRFVDGSTQVCTRVTPGVWTPRRLVGRPVGWLDTLTGSEHVVFETEEQAETFVARLAEAFEKGKA
jgi:hypothetical protein